MCAACVVVGCQKQYAPFVSVIRFRILTEFCATGVGRFDTKNNSFVHFDVDVAIANENKSAFQSIVTCLLVHFIMLALQ